SVPTKLPLILQNTTTAQSFIGTDVIPTLTINQILSLHTNTSSSHASAKAEQQPTLLSTTSTSEFHSSQSTATPAKLTETTGQEITTVESAVSPTKILTSATELAVTNLYSTLNDANKTEQQSTVLPATAARSATPTNESATTVTLAPAQRNTTAEQPSLSTIKMLTSTTEEETTPHTSTVLPINVQQSASLPTTTNEVWVQPRLNL
ncbi:hypothetical protein SRHO_G00253630, partial [Serrasalmus rhombeus]